MTAAPGSRTLDQWLRYIESVHHRSIDMSLDRVHAVLDRLQVKPLPFRILSVAGTNGKGSTVAMMASILRACGQRTGAYTSPHLTHYRERIIIDGTPVTDGELCRAFSRIDQSRADTPLTYFEFGTLAALLIFAGRNVDVAVLEVGMGGRLDAVNTVDGDVALVTNIAFDHLPWLGSDRESIGFEKAGIFRPGRPAVCVDPEPPASIADYASQVGAPLFLLNRDFGYAEAAERWTWWGPGDERLTLPRPALNGRVQIRNAAGVVMALRCFGTTTFSAEDLASGLEKVRLAGRFQTLDLKVQVVLDVAHNPAAAKVLRRNLQRLTPATRTHAVCGMMRDKPFGRLAQILGDGVDAWYLASIDDPRGAKAADLSRELDAGAVFEFDDIVAAFEAARRAAGPRDRIVVFGSFHSVGDILIHLQSVIDTLHQ